MARLFPVLGGVLSGVLPQDAGRVAAVFTTSAAALSPVGSYPDHGDADRQRGGELHCRRDAASLNIAKAPSLATLSP